MILLSVIISAVTAWLVYDIRFGRMTRKLNEIRENINSNAERMSEIYTNIANENQKSERGEKDGNDY